MRADHTAPPEGVIPAFGAADLTNCDREPLHIPGSLQPHGALLAIDPNDFRIVHAGGDSVRLLGLAPEALSGQPASITLSAHQLARLRELLDSGRQLARPAPAFCITDRPDGLMVDAVVHRVAGLLLLEFEARGASDPDDTLDLVQDMIRHAQEAETVAGFCDAVAAEIRSVSGFDRVMIYRFLPDGTGVVIAESRDPEVESFLGLHYPATDIPVQARALYLKNWSRMIPDARYAPAPIIPPCSPLDGRPLDLSQSVLRSISPLHRQYLANMGVVASMSLSLIIGGQLWGLIACHHRGPRQLSQRLRAACELFAEITSSNIEMKAAAEDFAAAMQSNGIHQELVARMSQEPDLAQGLIRYRPNLLDFIPAGGIGLWIEGRLTTFGKTPRPEEIEVLVAWLNAAAHEGVFHTDCLPLLYPPAEAFAEFAGGILALSVSRVPRDYVLWFRPELIRTVTWGGNPEKPVEPGPDGDSLTPRTSFAAWQQLVRLHCSPWLNSEVEAARRLRVSLLEVVLYRIDQIAQEREATRLLQAKLTQELDRRLVEWQQAAKDLAQESKRRAEAEGELSEILHRTVENQEAERLRIARELHDRLGQSLTLLQLGLDGIGQERMTATEVQQRAKTLKNLAAEVGREVNRLAWEIRPTELDDLGLQTALQNLIETWSGNSNLQFDLHLALEDQRLSAVIETTLYRVVQEALTNVVRHAEATRVGIILRIVDMAVDMIIEDNGRGFDTASNRRSPRSLGRMGLLGMRERLSSVGGSLEIESSPGKGTTLFVRTPVTVEPHGSDGP